MRNIQSSRAKPLARQSFQDRLLTVLQQVNRPGVFASHGSLAPTLPGLEITNVGSVGFPLTAQQAKLIRNSCEQAPYGKGEQTLVDTSVRRVWQIMPDKFSLNNPEWDRFLLGVVKSVAEELGLGDQQLVPQLYNLLLYEAGSFFLPHRDGEKVDRMVATLVLVLPSAFQGGELIVRHDGQERVIDFGAQEECAYRAHFAAFYADCEHEVLPLRSGFRLCLVYNLVLRSSKGSIDAPRNTERIEELARVLEDWCVGTREADARKLIVKLDHRYTRAGLAWDTLKGIDRTKAHLLREAANKAGCVAHIGELTYWEQGLGEEVYGRARRGRWHTEPDTISGAGYIMHEIYETSLTAKLWIFDEGQRIPFGELPIDEDEVIPLGSLTEVKPEEQFEGYMGNYGDTLERWYRHAAVVLWPKKCHLDLICQSGTQTAVIELSRMVRDLQTALPGQLLELRTECLQLAHKIVDEWQPLSHSRSWQSTSPRDAQLNTADFDDDDNADEDFFDSDDDEQEDQSEAADQDDEEFFAYAHGNRLEGYSASFLSSVELLGDAALIQQFLRTVVPKDSTVQLTASFLRVCETFGLAQFQADFKHILRNSTPDTLSRNIGLFNVLCSTEFRSGEEYGTLCAVIIHDLIAAVKNIDKEKDDWRSSKINRSKMLADLSKSLIATDDTDGLASLVSYTLSAPHRYPPRLLGSLLSELKDWLVDNCGRSCPALIWLDSTVNFLVTATAREPQKPQDFRREANVSCRCGDCKELIEFLKNPIQSVYPFKVRQERRAHLHRIIDSNMCDVNHITERKGSPQTLVCTKNTNSYQRSLQQYLDDMKSLALLQSLQKQLGSKHK